MCSNDAGIRLHVYALLSPIPSIQPLYCCIDCIRSREKRLQNLTCLATMAQQCAVAGHIAGMVQERSNVAASEHEDHQAADDPVAAHSQCVQVPVDMT